MLSRTVSSYAPWWHRGAVQCGEESALHVLSLVHGPTFTPLMIASQRGRSLPITSSLQDLLKIRNPRPLIGPLRKSHHPPRRRQRLLATPTIGVVQAAIETLVVAAERTLCLQQLVLLVQEVQAVVARQTSDGELVGHFGPLLPIGRHSLIQLDGAGEQLRQQPAEGQEVKSFREATFLSLGGYWDNHALSSFDWPLQPFFYTFGSPC